MFSNGLFCIECEFMDWIESEAVTYKKTSNLGMYILQINWSWVHRIFIFLGIK